MRRLVAVAVLLAVAACDTALDPADVRVDELSHEPAALAGAWELISTTTASLGPSTTQPASGERYVFAADGSVVVERDGQAPVTETWEVLGPAVLRIGDQRETFGVDGDRLYFDARPVDGALREYERR